MENRKEIIKDYLSNHMTKLQIQEKYEVGRKKLDNILKSLTDDEKSVRHKKVKSKFKHSNLIGTKSHHLTLITLRRDILINEYFGGECLCDCGRVKIVNTNYFKRGVLKSCGDKDCPFYSQKLKCSGKKNHKFNGFEEISGSRFLHIKNGAIKRNLEFTITIEYIWELFLKQDKKCVISGLEIEFGETNKSEYSASLDRIDSSKGYVEGNVQWVDKRVNQMKWNTNENDFINLCKKIVQHQIKK